ncbi:MAG: hypothetical protein ACHQWU_10495 [Gemmatimonadales bacterium]
MVLKQRGEISAGHLARLSALSSLDRAEREAFLGEHLRRRLRGASGPAALHEGILRTTLSALPESPTEVQTEAWLELAEMVSDPTFLAHFRSDRAAHDAARGTQSPAAWQRQLTTIFAPAAALARDGVAPSSPRGKRVFMRWLRSEARRMGDSVAGPFAQRLLAKLQAADPREAQFWELLGVLRPDIARSPVSRGMRWLLLALNEHVAARASGPPRAPA